MRTVEEFMNAQQTKQIRRWDIHDCGICGFWCGFVFYGDQVFYDPGCDCVYTGRLEPRTWGDLAEHYNRLVDWYNRTQDAQTLKLIQATDTFWGFDATQQGSS